MSSNQEVVYRSFKEFYPFYLSEHSNVINRTLHFIGTSLSLLILLTLLFLGKFAMIPIIFVVGYGFAWVGHFVFEKNKPATFKYPFYSFAGDWVMWFEIITGQRHVDSKYDKKY